MMLASESDCLLFQQPLHCAILRFCETPRTQSQIQTHCSIHPPATVSAALKELIAKRVLTTKVFPESRRDAAFWASTGVSPQPCEVDLQTHGSVPDALLRNALSSYSIAIDAAAFIALVAVDDYLQPDLARYLNHPKPFLLAKPVGASIWIGPIFTPQSRPCWNCLRLWMLPHRWLQFSRFCSSQPNLAPQPSLAATNATLATAAGLISTAVAIWSSSRRHPRLENRIVTLDVRTLESQQHVLRPHPDCPTCGSLARPIGELRQLVSPITGIVNKLDLTDRPAGALFHAAAQVVHALPSHAVTSVLPPQRTIGKGLTVAEAESSAIGEAVERYSISWRGSEPARIARLADVDALPLHSLFQFSPAQYAQRELWNAKNEDRQRIPQPFDASRPVAWCDVKSLVSGQIRQVPAAYCYMNYRNAEQPEIYFGDTNGCAAGSTHQAAALAAALELIERDAVAIWWYNRLRRPAVDLDSFGHDGILQIRDALRKIERSAYVLDITTGLGVPCFAAVVPKPDGSSPCFGAAAHPSAAIAAFRALSEAVQVWFWSTNLGGNSALQEFLRTTSATGDSFLAPETVSAAAPGEPRQTTAQMLDSVVQKLHVCGIESFELDCTRRETGVPVVRVIAPGLRHFWARFGPGRLYDVPVEMGWRRTPLPEEALNPVPCMI